MTESSSWEEGFPKAVKSSAGDLEASGFRLTSEDPVRVRYESTRGVFVLFFRDPQDYYVGFRVGLVAEPKDALTETEVLRLAGQHLDGLYPDSPEELPAAVSEVARRLREFGQEALTGAPPVYEAAVALRKVHAEKYTR
jgi:hypothetical protein